MGFLMLYYVLLKLIWKISRTSKYYLEKIRNLKENIIIRHGKYMIKTLYPLILRCTSHLSLNKLLISGKRFFRNVSFVFDKINRFKLTHK